jgi:hypothetical protein
MLTRNTVLEVDHWFGLAITAIQLQTLNYVLGDGRPSHNKHMKEVEGDGKWMCHNQIVQRDDFTSFSILGIVLIFLLGTLFIILDTYLERLIIFWYHKVQQSKAWKLRAWRGNRPLLIQSQALEAKGLGGTWEGTTAEVPITKHPVTFVSPFSVTIPEDVLQTKSKTNKCQWWQWRRQRIEVSGTTPTVDHEALELVSTDQRFLVENSLSMESTPSLQP